MSLREDIAALYELPEAELARWCEREGDGRYGSWASVVRALTWLRRGEHERALIDIDRALAKTPCFEGLELVCALLIYVAGGHARALELLASIAARHPRLANSATTLERERRARLGRADAHAHDARDLALAARLVLRDAGRERRPQGAIEATGAFAQHRAQPDARALTDADIRRFMSAGYLRLRGAFPRATAEAVVAAAERRIAVEPEGWVSDRGELRATDLRGYVAADPSTWPRGRLDLHGPSRVSISHLSPYVARAISQLLRGCARATSVWSDDLIIQFPTEVSAWRPRSSSTAWHLDSPSERTRLDALRTGLLVLVLYSDLQPNSGNTWLCPDSIAEVARTLAATPSGVDFCVPRTAVDITRRCRRFEQVSGEAGDVFLLHPLILHAASPNPSPRTRWAANPMIYLDAPLDHRRRAPSPVEAMIAAAVAG